MQRNAREWLGLAQHDDGAVVDEDGYVQISYWNAPGATPAQVAEVITAALAAITAATLGEPARVAGGAGR